MEQKKNTKTFTALHLHTFDILDKNNDDWSPSDPSLLHSLTLYISNVIPSRFHPIHLRQKFHLGFYRLMQISCFSQPVN